MRGMWSCNYLQLYFCRVREPSYIFLGLSFYRLLQMENMLIYALLCSNNFMPPMESHMLRNACVQAIKEQVLPCVHTGLEVIVDLVPMAAINLSTTVVQMRPMFFRKDFNTDHLKCHVSSICCCGLDYFSLFGCAHAISG